MSICVPISCCIILFCLYIQITFVSCFDFFFSQFLFLLFFLLFQDINLLLFLHFLDSLFHRESLSHCHYFQQCTFFLSVFFFFFCFGRDCLRPNNWHFNKLFSCTTFRYSFLASSKSLIYSLSFLSFLSLSSLKLLKSISKSVNNSFISWSFVFTLIFLFLLILKVRL